MAIWRAIRLGALRGRRQGRPHEKGEHDAQRLSDDPEADEIQPGDEGVATHSPKGPRARRLQAVKHLKCVVRVCVCVCVCVC